MKKAFVFVAMFAMLFSVTSCSKSDDKKKTTYNGYSVTVFVSEQFNVDVESLILHPTQRIQLKATVKDASGKVSVNAPVNWTSSSGLGTFSQNGTDETFFSVAAGVGEGFSITAEFGGITKTIPVIVDYLDVTFMLNPAENIIYPEAGMRPIKAIVRRTSNSSEDTSSKIIWDYVNTYGNFTQQYTVSDEWNGYVPPEDLFGSVTIYVEINGIRYGSPSYPVVAEN